MSFPHLLPCRLLPPTHPYPLHHPAMHYATKISLGTLATVGAFTAYYHTTSRRRQLPGPALNDAKAQVQAIHTGIRSRSGSLSQQQRQPTSPTASSASETQNQKEASQDSQWQKFTDRLAAANTSVLSTISLGNVLPDWSIGLPDWITRLQRELNMVPGSLADAIWSEARDPNINPEVAWDAKVRISPDLCEDEQRFLAARREFTRRALAKYLDIPEEEIHPDDVPVIASTGSGGGLRAMVAGASYYQALSESGLFDCTTYMAGVSGSCWLQSVYLSSIGQQDYEKVIEHLKRRISVHIAYPPAALELIDTPPTNKYLLRGVVEKLKVGASSFGLVDLYGLLLGARLLVPSNEMILDDNDLKLSCQKRFVDGGKQPLPIYTAVRHEIPGAGNETENQDVDMQKKVEDEEKQKDWFQWFEVTPYEVYSEDMEAGIPTWGLGRPYENGISTNREVPEMKLPLLFGIFGSAFCATLSHYYAEIRPFVTSINLLKTLDDMVLQRNEALVKVHPFDPASVPNFVKGLKDQLPATCPESLHKSNVIQLMDSGMSNNLACYPLMRKGRNVDIVIAFDSSADIQLANWIGYVEGYAKQRKIKGWPVSIGWPKTDDSEKAQQELEEAQAKSSAEAKEKLEEAQEKDEPTESGERAKDAKKALGPCTVWVGSMETRESEDEPPPSMAVEEEWDGLMRPDSGTFFSPVTFTRNRRGISASDPTLQRPRRRPRHLPVSVDMEF
ncbi:acyl transferase/acyl hydrolase/lysophospholipase [Sphaerosporella brunnea]|uniref:Lysophospholipase n=1 Tax=Sphaerosporella brunnea TaxID=1250544 RepID=A0A5J5F3B4_9PEZI|nr:acyl transferase/acyl hydrolase/lysophospholipase [Sphaerosporella brunnea]